MDAIFDAPFIARINIELEHKHTHDNTEQSLQPTSFFQML